MRFITSWKNTAFNKRLYGFLLGLLIIFSAFNAFALSEKERAVEETLERYRQNLQYTRAQKEKLAVGEDDLRRRLNAISEEIKVSKQEKTTLKNIFGDYRLAQNLRDAKDLTDQLAEISRNRMGYERREKQLIGDMLPLLDEIMDAYEKACLNLRDKTSCQKLLAYQEEMNELLIARFHDPGLKYAAVKILPGDTPRELKNKLHLLTDQKTKLRELIALCERRIQELAREKRMRRSMDEFFGDLEFFEDEELPAARSALSPDWADKSDTAETNKRESDNERAVPPSRLKPSAPGDQYLQLGTPPPERTLEALQKEKKALKILEGLIEQKINLIKREMDAWEK